MREFYEFGIPEDVRPRDVDYFEKRNSATVVTGMRRTGKTYVTYQRMRALVEEGVPLERIVHVNFDDDRLKGVKLEHLKLIGDVHAEMFPEAARENALAPPVAASARHSPPSCTATEYVPAV